MKNLEVNAADFACSFQNTAVDLVFSKLDMAIITHKPKSVSVVGGVSANSEVRKRATSRDMIIPNLKLTTDNASMIGCVAYYMIEKNIFCEFAKCKPNIEVEDIWTN
jgi:N6-L-threonylcarbamoyladenine synthase